MKLQCGQLQIMPVSMVNAIRIKVEVNVKDKSLIVN